MKIILKRGLSLLLVMLMLLSMMPIGVLAEETINSNQKTTDKEQPFEAVLNDAETQEVAILNNQNQIEAVNVIQTNDEYGDFEYQVITGGVKITKFTGSSQEVVIPSVIGIEAVLEIGAFAFAGQHELLKITVPESVTNIEAGAFAHCMKLTEINVAEGNTYYTSINGVLYDKAETQLISYPGGMTNFTIPASITSLGDYAVCSLFNLTRVEIPSTVTSIGSHTFESCNRLSHIVISENVTTIGDDAFANVFDLTIHGKKDSRAETYANSHGITFVDETQIYVESFNVLDQGPGMWANTEAHLSALGANGKTPYSYEFSYTRDGGTEKTVIQNYSETNTATFKPVTPGNYTLSVEVKDGDNKTATKSIANFTVVENPNSSENGFNYCVIENGVRITGYTGSGGEVIIPSTLGGKTVLAIENGTFGRVSDITKINIPETVVSINDGAFNNCYNLKAITVAANNGSYSSVDGILYDKAGTTLVAYPGGLTTANIPDGVTGIGNFAFFNNNNLIQVVLPNSATSIGAHAFEACFNLANILVPESVTTIGELAFINCPKLTIRGKQNSAAQTYAVANAIPFMDETQMYVESFNVLDQGPGMWANTEAHLSALGANGKTPYNYEFSYTRDGGTEKTVIQNYSETNTATFKPVSPGNYTLSVEVKDSDNKTATKSIANFTVVENPNSSENGFNYFVIENGVRITGYTGSGGNVVIPATLAGRSVIEIGDLSFAGHEDIQEIVIPETVTSIGYSPFNNCRNLIRILVNGENSSFKSVAGVLYDQSEETLIACPGGATSVSLPMRLKRISLQAFRGCDKLTSIVIPEGLISIGEYAFAGCSNLTSINIPKSVESIGFRALSSCPNLETVTVAADNPNYSCTDGVLYTKDETTLIDCAGGIKELNIRSTVTQIADYACFNLPYVKQLSIPVGVTQIGSYAFEACFNLSSVRIPESVNSFGEGAFLNCPQLIIVGKKDSAAETYATSQGITFVDKTQMYVESFTVLDQGPGMWANTEAHLSALGVNGKTPYSYEFSYTRDGGTEKTVIQNYSETNTATFKPVAPGNYTLIVEVKDSDNKTATKSITNFTVVENPNSSENGFNYCAIDNGVRITGYTGSGGNVVIPATLAGRSVMEIADGSFYGHDEILEIVIPETVISIGNNPFNNCRNLIRILVNSENPSFASVAGVLYDQTGETLIACPGGATSVSLTTGLKRIGNGAFDYCEKLSSITLPESVTQIGDYAFSGCVNLESIAIPESVSSIGGYTFAGCSKLTSITLPKNVANIGNRMLSSCPNLETVTVAADNPYYAGVDGVLYTKDQTTLIGCASGIKELNIPSTVTRIGDYACFNLHYVKQVSIPAGVTQIGSYAFEACFNLSSVRIPESVNSFGEGAFLNCPQLIIVGKKDSAAETYATSQGITFVDETQMYVESFTVLDQGPGMWVNTEAHLSALGVNGKTPYSYEFSYTLDGGTEKTVIQNYSETNTATFKPVAPGNYTLSVEVKDSDNKTATKSIKDFKVIADPRGSVDGFEYWNIDGGIRITRYSGNDSEVVIPSSLDGKTVLEIGDWAFSGHGEITQVTIPDTITAIGTGAFAGCVSLTNIVLSGNNTKYSSVDGILYDKAGTTLICYPAGLTTLNLKDGITSIGSGAFASCGNLTNISIPEGVTSIGDNAFENCYGINTMIIPEGVTTLGYYAFAYCFSLSDVIVPESIIRIENGAFMASPVTLRGVPGSYAQAYADDNGIPFENKDSVYVESFIADKGSSQYANTEINLTANGINGTKPYEYKFYYTLDENTVTIQDYSPANTAVFKPTKLGTYFLFVDIKDSSEKTATKRIPCFNIIENPNGSENGFDYLNIEGGVRIIGYTGSGGDIVIPSTLAGKAVLEIGENAFLDNTTLKTINIAKSIRNIGTAAFAGCSNLVKSVIPSNVETFGEDVFSGCGQDFTIFGFEGSEAEKYAKAKGISFIDVTRSNHTDYWTVDVPDGISITKYIGEDASVVIPKDIEGKAVVSIGEGAFANSANLTSISIAKSIISIDTAAFKDCSNLIKIVIPSNVTTFGEDIFSGCGQNLTIYGFEGSEAEKYAKTNNIRFIDVTQSNHTDYWTADVVGGVSIMKYTGEDDIVIIPDVLEAKKVVEIGSSAFDRALNLTSITIPDGVTNIGAYAFEGCPKLSKVVIPQSVTSMGYGVFAESPLTTIYGVAGSYAQTYAADNNLSFVDISVPAFEITDFTTTPAETQYINTPIQLSSTVTGGKAPYQYRYSYSLSGGTPVIFRPYGTTASASFTPTKAGIYTLTVDVKDASGNTASQSISDYPVVALPGIASFTATPAAGQTVGQAIALTAEGSGGMAPYSYKFYAKTGTTTIPVADYSEAASASFSPDKAGTYTLYVEMKDAGGKVATKTISNYTLVNALSVKTLTTDKASGQSVGTAIKLSATGSDGKSPYTYAFNYTLDGTTTVIQDYGTAGTASFTPTEVGSYTLTATIKDATGNTASKTIEAYQIVKSPGLSSFTTDLPSGQYPNTVIKLSATGSDGKAPYQYQFKSTSGGVTTIIQNYSATASATFKPLKAGNYTLTVDIKDANGSIGTASIDAYSIVGLPTVSSLSADPAADQTLGKAIILKAGASDGKAPYMYKFYAKLGTTLIPVSTDYSAEDTITFTPDKAGLYTLSVDIKDDGGKVATKSLASYTVVNPLTVKSFTAGKASGQAIGTTIALTALGSDGKAPYQYQFSYILDGGEETILKPYATTATASFIPAKAGNYTLIADITDATGATARKTITDYTILADPIVDSFTADAPNGQGVNTSINLSASGSSGKAPYQYQFYYKQGSTKVVIRPFAVTSTATFKPTKAGVYDLYVEIKDANGRIATKSQENYEIFGAPTVTSLTTDKASGQYAGTEINLTAAGSNGKAPYRYTFYAKLGTGTDKISIQDESDQNTAVFKPTQAGLYTLCVDVKDDNGIVATRTLTGYKVIGDPAIKTFTTGKVSGQAIGASIPLTALASDGKAPYQYQFSYTLAGETTPIKEYSTSGSATFSPTKAGSYTLTVNVKDASGIIGTRIITDYIILPDPVVDSFEATAPNGQGVNTSIQLTASGSSGKAPYQYQFYTKQGTTKVVIRPFAVTNTAAFKPTKAGTYDLYVEIKDANGRIATQSIVGYTIYTGPTVTSLTADKASGQYVDTAIDLSAAASGGTGPYTYDFYCKLGTGTDRISIQPEGDQNTAVFTPTTAGIYTLCVDVKDTNGIIASKTLANYKVIANPSVKSFIASKTSGQPVNTSITLTALGTDGKTPYQYKFTYNDGTTTTTIRDYSTLTTAIFKPTKAGTYTLTVEMKDGGGKTDTQTIETFEIK